MTVPEIFEGEESFLRSDITSGFLDRTIGSRGGRGPSLVINGEDHTMLRGLRQELARARAFSFSVAFVSPGAISLLKQELAEFDGTGVIITSDYLGFNSPAAFYELLNIERFSGGRISIRRHPDAAYHPKGYVFFHEEHTTAFLGSSNLTRTALVRNREWNLRVSAAHESELAENLLALVEQEHGESVPLTEAWVHDYELTYVVPASRAQTSQAIGAELSAEPLVVANTMQAHALSRIEAVRRSGESKGLVISATGTGKTILAALDVRSVQPRRMLFLVHREQIIDKAMEEFRRVLGGRPDDYSKLVGGSRGTDSPYLFATVQTMSRPATLAGFDSDEFDYIIIDEVHRAAAPTYARILEHFEPRFLLGLTATPERTDGASIYELFDYNVAYEIRLGQALDTGMLTPFNYFGVAEYVTDLDDDTDSLANLAQLTAQSRIDHMIASIELYGQVGEPLRGLIFCSRKDEARELSTLLNQRSLHGRQLRTVALTGEDNSFEREEAVRRLEVGDLDYILTVDIFNEGVDIPSLNQVIMLRQTQSAIIFVQQLGRGLRKAPNKSYVVVIDFIGNYRNNYLIPTALFGDQSLNKESLRRNLIAAEERGALANLSSIRFDRVAQERVLSSIATAKLDSMAALKAVILELRDRLGRAPLLVDFQDSGTADPLILATNKLTYPGLLAKVLRRDSGLTEHETKMLALLAGEVVSIKRGAELAVVDLLLRVTSAQMRDVRAVVGGASWVSESVIRSLDGTFYSRPFYEPVVTYDQESEVLNLNVEFGRSYELGAEFTDAVDDVLAVGRIAMQQYDLAGAFIVGRQYSRREASRILGWQVSGHRTIFGYAVNNETKMCPVFINYVKPEKTKASVNYPNRLLDHSTLRWYSRSNRTLTSGELAPILSNSVAIHVFAMSDDTTETEYFYLGKAKSTDAVEGLMPDGETPVVIMNLKFESAIPSSLFDYFEPELTR